MADWSNMQARCWVTYTDAIEGRKFSCKIIAIIPIAGDQDMVKVSVMLGGTETDLFADRVEININGSWRTVLSVWQEENAPTDQPGTHTRLGEMMKAAGGRKCVSCNAIIPPTGKRGRPATRCDACRGVA